MPRCPRGAGSVAGTTDPLRSNACYTGSQRRRGSRLRQFLAIRGSWSRLVALSHGTSWDSAASPTADGCSAICEAGAGRRGLPTPPRPQPSLLQRQSGRGRLGHRGRRSRPIVHSTSPALAAPRARVAGGAEEPLLARHIRSSKRRRQDAYATPRRRRTRARSRRLSLRLRERLCSPARTPRCRSSSISSVWLSAARVPARSRTQKSSSRATSASCATGSPGKAGVSLAAPRVLLRFVPSSTDFRPDLTRSGSRNVANELWRDLFCNQGRAEG